MSVSFSAENITPFNMLKRQRQSLYRKKWELLTVKEMRMDDWSESRDEKLFRIIFLKVTPPCTENFKLICHKNHCEAAKILFYHWFRFDGTSFILLWIFYIFFADTDKMWRILENENFFLLTQEFLFTRPCAWWSTISMRKLK